MTAMLIDDPRQPARLSRPLVLVIEDESRLPSFLDRALAAAGYRVERATDGQQALATLEDLSPDIVLLDLAQPGQGGLELARRLRARCDVPIVILSERDGIQERVAGLDAGADDYLTRPFALEELLARLRALRRGRELASARAGARARQGVLAYADLRVDLDTREAVRGSRRLELRNKGLELLVFFLRNPERVLSRRELLERVWGYEFLGDSNVIEVTVSQLRQALEGGGERRLIQTVRPVGYILNARPGTFA